MEHTISSRIMLPVNEKMERCAGKVTNLAKAQINREYVVKEVRTNDEELRNFLFTLGCYEGEKVTVLSVLGENYVISIKDARYGIDKELAAAIMV